MTKPQRAVFGVLLPVALAGQAQRPLPRKASTPVLQEPSPQEHYGFLRDYKEKPFADFTRDGGPPITRVTNLEDAAFQQMVRDGAPFVVDDCTRGFDEDAINAFECKDFARRWPSGNMRAEYTPGQYHIYLKDPNWYTKIEPQRAHHEHMAGKKKIAGPYIWHVKDEEPLKTKREVQQHWRTPYFLEKSIANRIEANESFEFWFSMAGGGTFTHADAYCESTISMQFKGKKRWRIQSFPRVKSFLNATSFGDSDIYENKVHVPWTPETEFTVHPGQCLIFPTGYLHETFVDPDENEGGCFTASTFQFNHPRQVNLYRAYLSSLSMSHYGMGEPCLQKIQGYATLISLFKPPSGSPDTAAIQKQTEGIFKKIDGDNDGKLVNKEFYDYFCKDKKKREKVMAEADFSYSWFKMLTKSQRDELIEEAMEVFSEDALQYHDIDQDGAVTVEELTSGFLQWSVVQYRLNAMKNLAPDGSKPNKWFKGAMKVEQEVLSKHFCEDSKSCEAVDDLEAHRKRLKDEGKHAMARKAAAVSGMLSGEDEGDDEALDMVDRESGNRESMKVGHIKGGDDEL